MTRRLVAALIAVCTSGIVAAPGYGVPIPERITGTPGRILAHDSISWAALAARPAMPEIPRELVEIEEQDAMVEPEDEPGRLEPASPEGEVGPVSSTEEIPNAPAVSSFEAIPYGVSIPDTNGAVGPNHVLASFNGTMQIRTKTGSIVSSMSQSTFWQGLGASGFFDPKTHYDPVGGRFITMILSNDSSASSSVMIAASQTSDPTGVWNRYRVDADPSDQRWADFPKLGFNQTWIAVRANMFPVSGSGTSSRRFWLLGTQAVYGGAASPPTSIIDPTVGGQVPVATIDAGQPTLYLATVGSGDPGVYRIDTITGTAASPVMTVGSFVSAGQPWYSGISGGDPNGNHNPQKDSTTGLQTNGSDMANPVLRNGSLWAAHAVYLPRPGTASRISVQWVQLTTAGAVQQIGRVDDPSGVFFYDFPSIAVNADNDVVVGYTRFSSTTYPSAAYSFRYGTDPPNSIQPTTVYKPGLAPYVVTFDGRNRWGDYSGASADPGSKDLWTVQQYAETPNQFGDRWGTWWARVIPHPAPAIDFNPSSLAFPNTVVGQSSSSQIVTVTSNGQTSLTITSVSVAGVNPGDFSKTADTCSGATLSPGMQCSVSARFTPTTTGARSGTLAFADNATGSPHTVSLTGTGVAPQPGISFSPPSLDFGNRLVGTTSAPKNVTVTSNGNTSLTITAVTLGGTTPGDYAIGTNTCTGATLTPGAQCTVSATFTPTAAGSRPASLLFADNAAGSPQAVPLSGVGDPPTPSISFNPTSLVWGDHVVGTTSSGLSVTVTSNGTGTLTISSVSLAGTHPGDFSIGSNTCTGASLTPGQTCTVQAFFRPTATGTRAASLRFTDNASGSPHSVGLTGTGIPPAPGISLSPTSLAYGGIVTGASSTKSVTISNTGNGTLLVSGLSITGAAASQFAVVGNTCVGASVSPAGACKIDVRFAPTSVGAKSATLSITSNAPGSPHTVGLSGTGLTPTPILTITPATATFGDLLIGSTASRTFTVGNDAPATGNLTVAVSGVSSSVAGDFTRSSDGCTGVVLAPGQSCTIGVTLRPSTLGSRTGSLIVNASGGLSKTATFSGNGIDNVTPDTTISTGDNAILLAGLQTVTGTAADAHSGVDRVTLTIGGTSVMASLACNAQRTSCTWSATVPITTLPGAYTITATARDLAGNTDPAPPSIRATII